VQYNGNWVMLDSLLDNPEWPSNISCDWFGSLSAANQNDPASKRPGTAR